MRKGMFFCHFCFLFSYLLIDILLIGGKYMKLIRKLGIWIVCLFSILSMTQIQPIKAANGSLSVEDPYHITGLTYEQAPAKWKVSLSTGRWDWYVRYNYNGRKVYCIDPSRAAVIGASNYSETNISSYVSNPQKVANLENISALGYGFNGDTSNEMDFATQLRLWQELYGTSFIATMDSSIQSKINTINERLHVLNSNVSFANTTITLKGLGKENGITLNDTSGSFYAYVQTNQANIHSERNGNKVTIWAEANDALESTLSYSAFKNATPGTSVVYQSPTSQNLVFLSGFHPKTMNIHVKVQSGSIRVHKVDLDTKGNAQGDGLFEGTTFDCIDNQTNQVVGKLVVGKDGYTNRISGLRVDHTYSLQEIVVPKGYIKKDTRIPVSLKDSHDVTVDVTNQVVTGKFKIKKITTDGKRSEIVRPEENAKFIAVLKKYVTKYGSIQKAYEHRKEFSKKEWSLLTTDKEGNATSSDLAYGKYVVSQIEGKDETELFKDTFEVDIPGQNESKEFVINNRPNKYYVRIVKKDAKTKKNVSLSSASFKIKKQDGTYVTQRVGFKTYDTFTTTSSNQDSSLPGVFVVKTEEKGTITTPLELDPGTYTLEEVEVPKGYLSTKPISFEIKKDKVMDSQDNVIEVHVMNEQPHGKVRIQKTFEGVDEQTPIDYSNLEFTLYAKKDIRSAIDGSTLYKEGDVVEVAHIDQDGKAEIDELPMGTYELKETKTIDGFILDGSSKTIEFTQKDQKTKEYVSSFDFVNHPSKVVISKTDVTGEKELEGAHLRVLDKDNQVIDEWISGNKPHIIEGITPGKYQLEETIAPKGYAKATTISFEVNNKDAVQKVHMIDKLVTFSKTDATGEKEVAGATIEVYNEENKVIDSWVSDTKEHKIQGLEVGKKYVLKEMISPRGYVQASEIRFKVSDDTLNQKVTMKDSVVRIVKVDQMKNAVSNAKLQVKTSEGKVVDTWVTGQSLVSLSALQKEKLESQQKVEIGNKTVIKNKDVYLLCTKESDSLTFAEIDKNGFELAHRVQGLKAGETYTIEEIETPKGYKSKASETFTVNSNGEDQTITWINQKESTVRIRKVNSNKTLLPGAKLELLDEEGKRIDAWTSDLKEHRIDHLIVGKRYTLVEKQAPTGYRIAKEISFKADEKETTITMIDESIQEVQTAMRTKLLSTSILSACTLVLLTLYMQRKKR